MIKQAIILAFFVLCSHLALSKTLIIDGKKIEVGPIIVNGSGCPSGTVIATATQDNTQIAILFSTYRAITSSTQTVATSDCNFAIPLSVGAGFSVGIADIDWRGSVFTAPDAFANFHREFFFSDSQGPASDTEWIDDGFENFVLKNRSGFIYYSRCDGRELIARADTSATVIGANSFFSLRAADVSARLLFTLKVRPC